MNRLRHTSLSFLVLLSLGCQEAADIPPATLQFHAIASPANPASSEPNLFAAANGRTYLSWIEKLDGERHALRFSVLEDGSWSPAKTIATGENWFVNWADFPAICMLNNNNGTLVAHWLAKYGPGPYSYGVNLTFSTDGGETWGAPVVPHLPDVQAEHGFVSLAPWQNDRLLVVWLDGRNTVSAGEQASGHGGHGGAMTLRAAILSDDGTTISEAELDDRVCDCCQTGATVVPGGALVAYRDRSDGEVRDISFVRYSETGWGAPQPLSEDGWEIPGCPVNGPAVVAADEIVVAAWFTAAGNQPMVKAKISTDGGLTFGEVIRIDAGDPIGRVDVAMLPDGAALVSWMAYAGDDAEIWVRRLSRAGELGQAALVARSSAARASGFPRMVRQDTAILVAFTRVGEPSHVQIMQAHLDDLSVKTP